MEDMWPQSSDESVLKVTMYDDQMVTERLEGRDSHW
jgi:hypothetical protein